jgi:predicted phosphate transport protein (TIGR00153 family)
MRFKLIPRNESFFPMFIDSVNNVVEGAEKLNKMIAAHLDDAETMTKEIKKIEKQGDKCTKAIIAKVHNSFITPFDREDIHELAEGIDDILDEILNVADVVVLHNVTEDNEHLSRLAEILLESCNHVADLVNKLSNLKDIDDDLEAISQCKRDARKVYRDGVSYLFSGELKSFDVLKLKDANESLREAVKQTDRVAEIIEAIAVKHS